MRRGRIFIYLALILILGVAAVAVIWFRFLQPTAPVEEQQQQAEATPVDIVNVVVTTQRVPRGAAITADVLGLVPIQRDLFLQGMFTDINAVEGRLAKFDLEAGIPLTSGMLVDRAEELSGTGSTAALSIPRGMVAVSIPIDRLSSVSYAPKPGDHVNVIVNMLLVDLDTDFQTILPNNAGVVIAPGAEGEPATSPVGGGGTVAGEGEAAAQPGVPVGKAEVIPGLGQTVYSIPSEKQRPRLVSQNLLQDAVVLQVGTFTLEEEEQAAPTEQPQVTPTPPPGGEAQQEQVTPEVKPPDVITLIVTPQDAITLNYLLYGGARMNLALRASGDDTRVQTEAVTLQFLLDQYNIPVPVKLPYGLEPRVDNLVQPELSGDTAPTPEP
jgi:Flp pilus assembly protein CpaB